MHFIVFVIVFDPKNINVFDPISGIQSLLYTSPPADLFIPTPTQHLQILDEDYIRSHITPLSIARCSLLQLSGLEQRGVKKLPKLQNDYKRIQNKIFLTEIPMV